MKRLTTASSVLVVTLALLACASAVHAEGPPAIDDSVMLSAQDVPGSRISPGGPTSPVHGLPPQPCGYTPTAPAAERVITIEFDDERHHAYEYVAQYPSGQAREALEQLREKLAACPRPAPGERYKILAEESNGLLLVHDFPDGDEMAAYYIGYTGDYLIAVMEVGQRNLGGDPTTASDLGGTAIRKAGGVRGTPIETPPSGPDQWIEYQAEVTGVRNGPDPRTLLIDVLIPSGDGCARDPEVTYLTEENNQIHANVVVGTLESPGKDCSAKKAGVATLTAASPVGDRLVVLNQEAWAPAVVVAPY